MEFFLTADYLHWLAIHYEAYYKVFFLIFNKIVAKLDHVPASDTINSFIIFTRSLSTTLNIVKLTIISQYSKEKLGFLICLINKKDESNLNFVMDGHRHDYVDPTKVT